MGLSNMIIAEGNFYHIKDEYFSFVQDISLMSNYEDGGYRPHFFAIRDALNKDIFWMIPVSSKYAKYKVLHAKMVARYKRCTKIVLGKCGGRDAAYLIQNAFPVTADYIDHVHTVQGKPLTIHRTTATNISKCLQTNLVLHQKGVNLFFADINQLRKMMEEHLSGK